MADFIYEILGFGFLFGVIIYQGISLFHQTQDKNSKYQAACAFAAKAGKPLLVAGGPFGKSWLRRFTRIKAHGNGNVCFDIDARAFHGCPYVVVADVRYIPFADKSFGAVFISHVLEHLPSVTEAKKALAELNRVAEAVFIAYPNKHYLVAWLIPDHHLWVWQEKGKIRLKQRIWLRKMKEVFNLH